MVEYDLSLSPLMIRKLGFTGGIEGETGTSVRIVVSTSPLHLPIDGDTDKVSVPLKGGEGAQNPVGRGSARWR